MTAPLSSACLGVLSSRAQHVTSTGNQTIWRRSGKATTSLYRKKGPNKQTNSNFGNMSTLLFFFLFPLPPPSPPELQVPISSVESSPPQPEKLSLEDLAENLSGALKFLYRFSFFLVFNFAFDSISSPDNQTCIFAQISTVKSHPCVSIGVSSSFLFSKM